MNPDDVNVPTPDEMTPEVMVSLINQLSELNDCALSDPMGTDRGQAEVGIYLQGRGRPVHTKSDLEHVLHHASVEYKMWFESFSDLLTHLMGDEAIRNLAHKNGWFTSTTVVESFGIGIPEPEDDGVTDEMVEVAAQLLPGHWAWEVRDAVAAAMAVQKNTP
jgi:hypothetical protein